MSESILTQHEAVTVYSERQVLRMTRAAHTAASALLDELGSHLKPGISEEELRALYTILCEKHGVQKSWHRPYIYFGTHTINTCYDTKPKDNHTLGESDIALIDLGPVIPVEGVEVEGDFGQTFAYGNNPLFHALKQASEELFEAGRNFWHAQQPTGVELYRHIHRLTEERGLIFNLKPAGHLIGSFPHRGWKEGLDMYPYIPEPGIWILEIQVRHPVEPYGAFYEAVLI